MRKIIKLVSSAGTGDFAVTIKNNKQKSEILALTNSDPRVRRHVEYREAKLK